MKDTSRMDTRVMLYVAVAILGACLHGADAQIRESEGGGEYCLTEAFEGSCSEDEVVLMTSARYGRMQLGRCVKTDFGFVGCSRDVLDLADTRCSGQRKCKIGVPDPLFEETKPCNEEFKSYLQATYSCVRVVSAQPRLCQVSKQLKISSQSGYIASVVTEETGCGTEDVPWVIEVKAGQRINLTLHDFWRGGAGTGDVINRQTRSCVMYGYLRDETSPERQNICGGKERERHLFTSVTNKVSIHLLTREKGKGYFMIYYEAIGCPDPIAPRGAWVKRDGETVTMGCSKTGDVWRLTCSGHTWHGHGGNCTVDDDAEGAGTTVIGVLSLPVGVAITLILAIAVGVSALILLAGLLVIRRKRYGGDKKPPRRPCPQPTQVVDGTLRRNKEFQYPRPDTDKLPYSRQPLGNQLNDNEYAYVWETNQSNALQQCSYCAENCNLSMNIHDVECGHYGAPCAAHSGGESVYEKSTYSGRRSENRAPDGSSVPQYFELDPEGLPKGSEGGRDSLSGPGGPHKDMDKKAALRKYNMSDGNLDASKGLGPSELDEPNRLNYMGHHGTS